MMKRLFVKMLRLFTWIPWVRRRVRPTANEMVHKFYTERGYDLEKPKQ